MGESLFNKMSLQSSSLKRKEKKVCRPDNFCEPFLSDVTADKVLKGKSVYSKTNFLK